MKKAILFVFALVMVMALAVPSAAVVLAQPSEAEIDAAIDEGMVWLAAQQNPDGSWGASNQVAKTGFAVVKFETHAINLGVSPFDPAYPYAGAVQAGLNYLFANAYVMAIDVQPAGDPDTDGDGIGVYFVSPGSSLPVYETGIAMMAVAASTTPGRIVDAPPSAVIGWTYKEVLCDAVDYLAWAQTDSGYGRGGWNYGPMDSTGDRSDNSITGYAVLGLAYAEAAWPYNFMCPVPAFVRPELDIWIDYIQNDVGVGDPSQDGGSGYTNPELCNTLRTGNLLFEMAFVGDGQLTPRVQDAIDYLVRHWGDPNPDPGWRGTPASYQAMYTTMKGLEVLGIHEFDGINWQDDFATVLLEQQNADGSWPSCVWDDGEQILSTEWAVLTLQKVVPPTPPQELIPEEAWNVMGTQETFRVPGPYNRSVVLWRFMPALGLDGGWSVVDGGNDGPTPIPYSPPYKHDWVTVQGANVGELVVVADTDRDFDRDGVPDSLYGVKKWGKINETIISESGSTEVVWCEDMKQFVGEAEIYEMVIGTFEGDPEEFEFEHPANGADVEWWLLNADAPVHDLPMYGAADFLVNEINAMHAEWAARHVVFASSGTTMTATTSGDTDINGDGIPDDGATSVTLIAEGEEAVKVICLAKYPYGIDGPQWPVFIEMTSWNFWTQQLEKVPQVRWAGEKIVLEKQFGMSYAGDPVIFYLENQSVGTLEGVGWVGKNPGIEGITQDTVVGKVDCMGVARAILTSESPGECDVTCALYHKVCPVNFTLSNPGGDKCCYWKLINQHGFVVFFLKLEDITLGNVYGERMDNPLTDAGSHWEWNPAIGDWEWVEGHDSGIWDPANPYDPSTDMMAETLNVSEDTLLRARVKGWFMGDDLSTRLAKVVDYDPTWDSDGDGDATNDADMMLPAGRWVLPDDWPRLAGPRWEEFRPHWDLMDNPMDPIASFPDSNADKLEELGPYLDYSPMVTGEDPDLVAMAPVIGPYNSLDNYTPLIEEPKLGWKTIIPNGVLDWWDCPMPPAKIIFEIDSGPGFFKEVNKGHVYYALTDMDMNPPSPDSILYTNPYYYEWIPAHILIPPFVNNGGYDWNSWDGSYGPYPFWDIFNQPNPYDDPQHPTKVEVYSDNHGEAMVYLNGDWNLDLSTWQVPKPPPLDAYDVPPGTEVGSTDVVAIADYPYMRKHPVMVSNEVCKTWTWGKEILTGVLQMTDAEGNPVLDEKWVGVWVCDRDGFPAVGEEIKWMSGGLEGIIEAFLPDTHGVWLNPEQTVALSWTRLPTPWEKEKFEEFYGEECHHAVAAVVVHNSLPTPVDLHIEFTEREGVIIRDVVLDFGHFDPVDPLIHLDAGLNLIGWVAPDVPTADGVASLGDALATVWGLNGGVWQMYSPTAPPFANDLALLEYAKGYFFYMNYAIDWNLGS